MATPALENSQEQGSSFESLFIRFDGLQGSEHPQELTRDAQNLEIAAGQPWENAIAELREELDLPVERFKLTLHRLRGGQKWRIAKSAWGGIKSEEELYLVAAPINTEEDRKPKDEPKPKPSPPRPVTASKQPISPESLARFATDGRRSLDPEIRRTPSQELVVPATPEDSTVSDTEDEAMPLDAEEEEEEVSKQDNLAMDRIGERVTAEKDRRLEESETLSGLGIAKLDPPLPAQPESSQAPPQTNGAAAIEALPPLNSQFSTGSIEEDDRRDSRRSFSPSPSQRSTKLGILQQHSSFGSPPPRQHRSSTPPCIKPPPSSAPSLIPDQTATPVASTSSSFPPPAQPLPRPAGPVEPVSSQPSDLSDASFRIGIDSSGQVNFVPASSPQITSQQLPQPTVPPLGYQQATGVGESEMRRSDKGKGKASETPSEEEEEVVLVRSPRVKREPRSSPRQDATSKSSPTRPRTSISSFSLEIVSPPKRQLTCRIAPRKKRRLTDSTNAADVSNSTVSTDHSASSNSSSQNSTTSSASRPPSALNSATHPLPPPSICNCQVQQVPSRSHQHTAPPSRKKARSSLSMKQKKLEEEGLALARPRVEIPPFPSSGRFCLFLRLPNVPVAPKWAGPRLKPLFLLKYQGNGSSTLGNVLSHVFRFVSNETGWNVKDLRLRYTDLSEEEGSDEREKYAWGFDTLLTDFQNLEEWRVGTQDFLDVDYIPFSSSRTWMDTE
ncbi:hypothetical protein JCM3765_003149 [Sporobolomyces pararoseus]